MPLILPSNTISAAGFDVDNSVRFEADNTSKLTRTNSGTSTNNKKGTFSGWWKLQIDGSTGHGLYNCTPGDASERFLFSLSTNGTISGGYRNSSRTVDIDWTTGTGNALFRDTAAWYHIVINYDTSDGTGSNRVKVFVNNVQHALSFSPSDVPQDTIFPQNKNGEVIEIGHKEDTNDGYGNAARGYLSEMIFVDGQQLAPTEFGEYDADTGIWVPKQDLATDLTFGTFGFYYEFQNSGSLGTDSSGNSNTGGVSNLSQTTDTCTNNYATLNSLSRTTKGTVPTISEGNLQAVNSSNGTSNGGIMATIGTNSGKWYWEAKVLNNNYGVFGIALASLSADEDTYGHTMNQTGSYGIGNSGLKWVNGSSSSDGTYSFSTNDILMCAMDLDNNFVYFGNNGTWYASGDPTSGSSGTNAFSSFTNNFYIPTMCNNNGNFASGFSFNFGNPAFSITSGNSDGNGYGNFEYSVPSGYYALNTKNLAEFG